MCGIVGFLNSQTDFKERQARKQKLEEFMRQGLLVDALRGMDGTGVARVERKSLTRPAEVFKKSIPSSDFLQLRGADKILEDCDDVSIMIGHNRFSTRGAFKGDENAHPFQVEHITLVHNGGITNYHQLTKKNPTDVDSSYIAGALSEEEPDVLLPKLYGSYSLVWHDARDGSLNMARNEERPMVLVKLGTDAADWPAMIFGSEPHMLLWLMMRNGMKYHDGFTSTAIHTWYKFMPDRPFEPQRTVYEPRSRSSGGNPHSFQKGRAGSATALPEAGATEPTTDTGTRGPTSGGSDPGSKRLSAKERKWAQRLQKAGLRFGEVIYAKAVEFIPHRNDPNNGTGYFTLPTRKLDVQVHNMRKSAWDVSSGSWASLRCQTARQVKNDPNQHVIIATWIASVRSGLGPYTRVTGPYGQKINRQHFQELTEDGCYTCQGVVNAEFADDMLWVHGQFPHPICHECAKDGSVRLKFGIGHGQMTGRMMN